VKGRILSRLFLTSTTMGYPKRGYRPSSIPGSLTLGSFSDRCAACGLRERDQGNRNRYRGTTGEPAVPKSRCARPNHPRSGPSPLILSGRTTHNAPARQCRTTPTPWDCVSSRLNGSGIGAWSLVFGCQSIAVGGARVTRTEGAAEGLDLAVARAGSQIDFHALDEFTAADRQARAPLGHSAV
jgi:hypothetical protein